MNHFKKVWLLFVVFALAGSVFAQETFTIKISPSQRGTRLNESAQFELSVGNRLESVQRFEVYSSDVSWDVNTDNVLSVPPGEFLSTKLFVKPLRVNPGTYAVPIVVRKEGASEAVKNTVFVELRTSGSPMGSSMPVFKANASITRLIDPRAEVVVSLELQNLNRRNLSDVSVKLRSSVFNKDYSTSLDPLEVKRLTFKINMDQFSPPQRDELKIYVIKSEGGKSYQYEVAPLPYEIVSYENFVSAESLSSHFLQSTSSIKITNLGNTPKDDVFGKKINFFKRLFSTARPSTLVVKGAYTWKIPLDVGEERTLEIVTDYRNFAIFGVIILIAVGVYFAARPPLKVRKSAIVASSRDGGISELKVKIELKNRSRKVLRNVNVIDLVPEIFDIDKRFDGNMIAPSKIVTGENKGVLLKWDVENFDGKEERVFVYKMRAQHPVMGGLTLPVTVSKFVMANGKEQTTYSNKFRVGFVR